MRPATQETGCVLEASQFELESQSIFFWISISVAVVSHLDPSVSMKLLSRRMIQPLACLRQELHLLSRRLIQPLACARELLHLISRRMIQRLALADAWQMRPATEKAAWVMGASQFELESPWIFLLISISVAVVSHLDPKIFFLISISVAAEQH